MKLHSLNDTQLDALKTLAANGSSTKGRVATMRVLVSEGYATEQKRFEQKSVFRVTGRGLALLVQLASGQADR